MATYLQKILISEYKSFYDEQEIVFSQPNSKNGSGLTILIGKNNSGKSVVFEAIKRMYRTQPLGSMEQLEFIARQDRHIDKGVKISLYNSDKQIKEIQTLPNNPNVVFTPPITNFQLNPIAEVISARRFFHGDSIATTIPKRDMYNQQTMKAAKSNTDNAFTSRLLKLFGDEDKLKLFNGIMARIFYDFKPWDLDFMTEQNIRIVYRVDENTEHSIHYTGEGINSVMKIVEAIMDKENKEKIIFIDEPEQSLHPQAQRALLEVISEYSSDRQIVIATHSPIFVSGKDLTNGASLYRFTKDGNATRIFRLSEENISTLNSLMRDWMKPFLLGSEAKEIFFSDKVLFLEGQEDKGLLDRYLGDKNEDLGGEIYGYGSGGSGQMKNLLQIAKDIGISRVVALFDKDTSEFAECEKLYKDSEDFLILQSDKKDIRDKFNKDGALVCEGYFNKDGSIKDSEESNFDQIVGRIKKHFSL